MDDELSRLNLDPVVAVQRLFFRLMGNPLPEHVARTIVTEVMARIEVFTPVPEVSGNGGDGYQAIPVDPVGT